MSTTTTYRHTDGGVASATPRPDADHVYVTWLSHGYPVGRFTAAEFAAEFEPVTTYGYHARDASGHEISRVGLDAAELRQQWGNLIVSGYIIEVAASDGTELSDDDVFALVAD